MHTRTTHCDYFVSKSTPLLDPAKSDFLKEQLESGDRVVVKHALKQLLFLQMSGMDMAQFFSVFCTHLIRSKDPEINRITYLFASGFVQHNHDDLALLLTGTFTKVRTKLFF